MSVEFGKARDYGVNLLSRSLGIEYYRAVRESAKLDDAIGGEIPPLSLDNVISAGIGTFSFLGGSTFRTFLALENFDSAPIPEKSRFPKRLFLPAIAADLAPFALMAINPLLFFTKPLLNVVGIVIGDIAEKRLLGGDKLPEASEGVYGLLEDAYNRFYEKEYGAGIIRNPEGKVLATIVEERVCVVGGSCLELRVASIDGNYIQEGTHITRGNRIVNTFSFITNKSQPEENPAQMVDYLISAALGS